MMPSRMLLSPMKSATKAFFGSLYMSSGVPICWMRPRSMTTTVSLIASASSWSCVTYIKVMPSCCCMRLSSFCMSLRRRRSSAPSGSSSSSTSGRFTSARAMATRCCWPPESWSGLRFSKPLSDTISSISVTRCSTSFCGTLAMRRPKATFSNTFRCGNSAYFWNTVLMRRLWGGTSLILTPSNSTSPLVGWRKPPMIRRVVVLPQPEGPSSVRNSLLLK